MFGEGFVPGGLVKTLVKVFMTGVQESNEGSLESNM